MPSTAVTIDKLEISPFNVRKDKRDIEATSAMERSLLAKGQIFPFLVHPLAGKKGMFGVIAGGRRLRSFRKLIDAGKLPADHPIDIIIRDVSPVELVELSTTENLIRRDMRPYEVAEAVLSAHRKGHSAETVAEELGQELIWVRRYLRLAGLAPAIFAAFAAEEISFDQAAAYAATEDQDLQLLAFKEIQAQPLKHLREPDAIRSRLKVNDRELNLLLRLVGEETYREAGGRYELDLFADNADQRGRVQDEPLLRKLADQAMEEFKRDLRRRAGREDLRFVVQPPRNQFGTDYTLRIDDWEKKNGEIALPAGEVVAWVKASEAGEPEVSFWWDSKKAKFGSGGKPAARARLPANAAAALSTYSGDTNVQLVRAVIKEKEGVTADGVEIFRSLRRLLMRAFLIWDARAGGTAGQDYLIWSQLRLEDWKKHASQLGVYRLTHGGQGNDPAIANEHLEYAPAMRVWDEAREQLLNRPAFTLPDDVQAFLAYRGERAELKQLAGAVVAGMALERSLNAHGYQVPLHDALADHCRVTGVHEQQLRQLWQPSAELLGRLPAAQLLAIAKPFIDEATFARWSRGRASELPDLVATLLNEGKGARTAGQVLGARQWVHPLLRFNPLGTPAELVDAAAAVIDDDAMLESAAS